jgi:hypothetical protein
MPLRQAFTYNYPVLRDSIENDSYYSIDHFIDIVNNNRNCASNEATLFHRGHISNGHKNGDYCFIQFWMYETASYAPYGIPIFGNSFWHEGDWEMVQICVKLTGTKKSDWFRPHAATASQHYYGQTLAWRINQSGPETQTQEYVGTEDNGNRVKIYIAENSHATYFRKGEINAAIYGNKSKCETQVQYEPIATILPDSFDKISAPLLSSRVYHLIPLNYKADKGIGDWPGIWGDSGGILPGTGGTSSPFFRKANTLTDTLNLDSESVLFHNNCRKIISGTLQPETEL